MSGERVRKSMGPFSSSKDWKLGVTLSATVLYEHDQARHIFDLCTRDNTT
jgi:hypothetical protein